MSSNRDELVQYLFSREWQQAIEVLQPFVGTEYETLVLETSLANGMINDAPIQFFETLFDQGGKIPENAIMTLSFLRRGELTQKLIPHGLDLNFVAERGINALGVVITTGDNHTKDFNPMFTFLLVSGVNSKPSGSSLDPLNLALQRTANEVPVHYARLLIDHGAPIEFSHRHQMETLKLSYPDRYNKIVEYIPELRI